METLQCYLAFPKDNAFRKFRVAASGVWVSTFVQTEIMPTQKQKKPNKEQSK